MAPCRFTGARQKHLIISPREADGVEEAWGRGGGALSAELGGLHVGDSPTPVEGEHAALLPLLSEAYFFFNGLCPLEGAVEIHHLFGRVTPDATNQFFWMSVQEPV